MKDRKDRKVLEKEIQEMETYFKQLPPIAKTIKFSPVEFIDDVKDFANRQIAAVRRSKENQKRYIPYFWRVEHLRELIEETISK